MLTLASVKMMPINTGKLLKLISISVFTKNYTLLSQHLHIQRANSKFYPDKYFQGTETHWENNKHMLALRITSSAVFSCVRFGAYVGYYNVNFRNSSPATDTQEQNDILQAARILTADYSFIFLFIAPFTLLCFMKHISSLRAPWLCAFLTNGLTFRLYPVSYLQILNL